MQGLNPLTMQCAYSTPCGWCTKFDKKCDKKIDNESVQPYDDAGKTQTNQTCKSEENHEWVCVAVSPSGSSYICKKCHAHEFRPFSSSSHYSIEQ